MARILLIDDDDLFRSALQENLVQFGHTVAAARNGKEGLALFEQSGADLVITDIVMPEKEGIETVTELRAKHPGLRIIAISGGGRGGAADYLRFAQQLGAAKILAKPFPGETLRAAIDELLSEREWRPARREASGKATASTLPDARGAAPHGGPVPPNP